MQTLLIHSHSVDKPSKQVEVEPSTTLLDLRYQLFSVTDIPPERILLHYEGQTLRPDDDVDATRTLTGMGINFTTKVTYSDANDPLPPPVVGSNGTERSPVAQHTISLDELGAALDRVTSGVSHLLISDGPTDEFLSRVRRYQFLSTAYEGKALQEKALSLVPLETLKKQATERLATDEKYPTYEYALAKELLHWFKKSFFSWVDSPMCWSCGKKTTLVNVLPPSANELKFAASRTEQYTCASCGAETRFPRYDDVSKLLETRRGRCGEWAKTFTLIVRAAGLKARAVYDWTDHVWTEVWCGRWVHADSCEDVLDRPLLYEVGWKKKLNYCVAAGVDCVVDVTRRYTKNFDGVCERRTLADEGLLQTGLRRLNEEALARLEEAERAEAMKRYEADMRELGGLAKDDTGELLGRQSGNAEWVKSRGEDGSAK